MSDFSSAQKQYMDELFLKLTNAFSEKTTEIRKEFKRHITELKQEVESTGNLYQEKLLKLEEENKVLQTNIIQLQRKVRKNNIVIFGINNTIQNLSEFIITTFNNKLEVDIRNTEINDIYRIGQKNKENQPVVVEFISLQRKKQILQNAKKLKGTNLFISQDQCAVDQANHKILVKHLKQARQNGIQAYIKGYQIVIGGETYTANDLETRSHKNINTQDLEKPDSAPPTPNPQVRQKRLLSELGLEDDENKYKEKINKPTRIEKNSLHSGNIKIRSTKNSNK